MDRKTISVTEAARNFADCVNRAHYQHTTFVLLKNGLPMARLVPDDARVCTGRALAHAVARTELTGSEFKAGHRDLRTARKALKTPADRWQ